MGDAKTYDLFDESELGPATKAAAMTVVIRAEKNDSLPRRQRAFNCLAELLRPDFIATR